MRPTPCITTRPRRTTTHARDHARRDPLGPCPPSAASRRQNTRRPTGDSRLPESGTPLRKTPIRRARTVLRDGNQQGATGRRRRVDHSARTRLLRSRADLRAGVGEQRRPRGHHGAVDRPADRDGPHAGRPRHGGPGRGSPPGGAPGDVDRVLRRGREDRRQATVGVPGPARPGDRLRGARFRLRQLLRRLTAARAGHTTCRTPRPSSGGGQRLRRRYLRIIPSVGPGSRGATMDEYLASAPIVSTGHLDEAREAVSRIYLRHELVGSDNGMAMRLNAVVDRVMTVGYLTYQADTELIMPATEDCYVINLTLVDRKST